MTTTLPSTPTGTIVVNVHKRSGENGGAPARRAVARWAFRLVRREWRQQALVLCLLALAAAATTVGLAVADNSLRPGYTRFVLPGTDQHLDADLAAFRKSFPEAEVVAHQTVPVPGSVSSIDLRAQAVPKGVAHPTVRLISGRYPTGPGEVALTEDVAALLRLRIGDTWDEQQRALVIVGRVENPQDLGDRFALVAPGQADPPVSVSVEVSSTFAAAADFRLHNDTPLGIEAQSSSARTAAAVSVLALATVGLLFVGLVAVAGFTVMAQRRLRSLGMLGAMGATDRHVRWAMLANGAAVGAIGAVVGTALGLAGWLAWAPRYESIAGHRIDRFNLPWWAVAAGMILSIVAAVGAAWWPARAAARIPVVVALSGRPPKPRPAHHFAFLGAVLLVSGPSLLAVAHQRRPAFIITGSVATVLGVLLIAPLAIRVTARAASRVPIPIRLAVRDLGRYQARSGAALGAVTLAVGIAAAITVAAAAQAAANGGSVGNLPANQLIVYLSGRMPEFAPELSTAQQQAVQSGVAAIAGRLHAKDVLTLDVAVDMSESPHSGLSDDHQGRDSASLVKVTNENGRFGEELVGGLYVATPDLLAHYGIKAADVDPAADLLTSRTDLAGLSLGYGPRRDVIHPKIQTVPLPAYTSAPNTFVTSRAVQTLGLQPVPTAWLVDTPRPLTTGQIGMAQQLAAAAGVTIETRDTQRSLARLGHQATAAGVLFALTVLAMTVGLMRSETADDLRTLTATGATSHTRRSLTAATAGSLALVAGLLGTGGAYLAMVAWYHSDLHLMRSVPVANLLVIVAGLPLIAAVGGWLFAGRQPQAIGRRPTA